MIPVHPYFVGASKSVFPTRPEIPRSNVYLNQASDPFHTSQWKDSLYFSGNNHSEENGLNKATSMFREANTLDLVTNYLQKQALTNPNTSFRIADYACSSGEEAYSLALLLKDAGLKYSITGYDLPGPALDEASQGRIGINNKVEYLISQSDLGNLQGRCSVNTMLNVLRRLQHTQFEDEYLNAESIPAISNLQRRKYYQLFHENFSPQPEGSSAARTQYQLKPEANLKCEFKPGDIRHILEERGYARTNVILFRNALYHLISRGEGSNVAGHQNHQRASLDPQYVELLLTDLFKQFNRTLCRGGLLVMGQNEGKQHTQQALVEQILKEAGFERVIAEAPVYYKTKDV